MKKVISLFALLFFPLFGVGQISIINTDEIAKIKTGTTYFAMKDPAASSAVAYVEAIKKNWIINKVEVIKYTDVEKNISPNSSFVTITVNMKSSNANENTESHIYLELWTTNGKFVYDPKKRRHFNQEDKIPIATIELFADVYAQNNPSSLYKMDYDMAGHFKNWGVGIFSNYLQQLSALLNESKRWNAEVEYAKPDELNKLNSSTLFIPDYVLTKFNKNSDDESKKYSLKEVLEGVSLSTKLISIEELNQKILNEKDPFYYLLFIKTNSARYVSVTNSQTGQFIYTDCSKSSANFKAADLKQIQGSRKKG